MLAEGDRLVVSELSRLGRNLGQVIQIVDELVNQRTPRSSFVGTLPSLASEAGSILPAATRARSRPD